MASQPKTRPCGQAMFGRGEAPRLHVTRRLPAVTATLMALCLSLASPAQPAATSAAPATQPCAAQLQRECEDLIARAVRRPYGWGWSDDATVDPKARGGAQQVSFDPSATPAAGLVLFWAGDLLECDAFKEAALQAARGCCAAQRPTGRVLARPIFAPSSGGGKEELTLVADRAPTRAALGLLLTLVDERDGKDTPLRSSAVRATFWLMKQQAPNGAWPIGYPPATAPKDAARAMRLDTPDFRDSTFALLLAGEVLKEPAYRRAADRAVDLLQRIRLGDDSIIGASLWGPGYTVVGVLTNTMPDAPPSIDLLASRRAMQTLLGGFLALAERKEIPKALFAAADAIGKIRPEDGRLRQRYPLDYDPNAEPVPTTKPAYHDPFARAEPHTAPDPDGLRGLDKILPILDNLVAQKREELLATLAVNFTFRQHLAATLAGLTDAPFATDLPSTKSEINAYLKAHDQDWKLLDVPPPDDLAERTHRLWLLLIRAKLERRAGGGQ